MEFLPGLRFLDLVCEFLIKSSLVLAVSLLLVFLFRKKSASMRHFLLSFSLISLILFPFLSSITTGWETRWLPSWQTAKNSSLTLNESEKNKDPLIHLNQENNTSQANGPKPSGFEKTRHQNEKTVFLKTIGIKKLIGLSLITIWTAGLIFLLIRIFLGLYGAHRLTRQGKRISGSLWQLLLQRFLNAISIRRKISLLSHDQVRAPLTWGVIKPIVIIPADSRNWTKDQCSSALFHELSHIKRSDFLIKILARFSCSLYWFNPLSWFVFRLMKKEQEKACDELVLKAGVKPSTYAANLLSIKKAGQIQWNPPAAALGAVGKSQLNERLLAILKQQLKPKEVKMKTKILLSFFVITAIIFIGLARPSQTAASNEKIFSDKDTILTEAQNPSPADIVQEKQEKKKSKKADKKESTDKKGDKKKVTCVSKDEKPAHIHVWICKDAKTKKILLKGKLIKLGKPTIVLVGTNLALKKYVPEKYVILSISGKDVELKKGEEGHLTLKADKIDIIKSKDAKFITLSKGKHFCIKTEKGKDGKNIFVIKSGELHLKKCCISPISCTIHVEGGKGEKKKLHITPNVSVHVDPLVEILPMLRLKTEHKKFREKLKKLQEKLEKIKELEDKTEKTKAQEEALKDVEEALKEMSKELEREPEKLKDLKLGLKIDLKHKLGIKTGLRYKLADKIRYTLADKIKHIEKIEDDFTCIDVKGDKKIVSFIDKDECFQVIIKSKLDSEKKGKYEEVLKELKEGLPEGYKAESEINEKDNTIIITITTEKKGDESKKEFKKLVKEIVDKLSKIEKKTSKDEKKLISI